MNAHRRIYKSHDQKWKCKNLQVTQDWNGKLCRENWHLKCMQFRLRLWINYFILYIIYKLCSEIKWTYFLCNFFQLLENYYVTIIPMNLYIFMWFSVGKLLIIPLNLKINVIWCHLYIYFIYYMHLFHIYIYIATSYMCFRICILTW